MNETRIWIWASSAWIQILDPNPGQFGPYFDSGSGSVNFCICESGSQCWTRHFRTSLFWSICGDPWVYIRFFFFLSTSILWCGSDMENIRIRNAGLARIPRYWYRVTNSVQDPDPFWFWREDLEYGSRRTLNLEDPEPNENDTLDPNPHPTKMSDHDTLPSWSESVTLQNRTHSCPFKILKFIKKQCCGSGSARSTSF